MSVLSKGTIKESDVISTVNSAENRSAKTLKEASLLTTENMKWNRYKPVNWDSATVDRSTDNWTLGKDGHYGIVAPTGAKNALTLKNRFTSDGKNGWGYVTKTAPYRLGDFRGFDTDVKRPYMETSFESVYYDGFLYFPRVHAIASANALTPQDIINTYGNGVVEYNAHFGIMFEDTTSGYCYITTNLSPKTSSVLPSNRTYNIYPIICPRLYPSITSFNDTYDVDFFPYPNATRKLDILIDSNSSICTCSCVNMKLGSIAKFNPHWVCSTADYIVVRPVYVYKRFKTSTTGSALKSGESKLTGYQSEVQSSYKGGSTTDLFTTSVPVSDYSTMNFEIYANVEYHLTVGGADRTDTHSEYFRVNVTPVQSS